MRMRPFTENEAGEMFANPFYAIVLQDYLFEAHELEGAKEDWVLKNTEMVKEMSANDWLEQLLTALSTKPQDSPTYTLINPYKAIRFSKRLQEDHEPIIAKEMWISANVKMMEEVGAGEWLWKLLNVLETGGPS